MKYILIVVFIGLFNLSHAQSFTELKKALQKEFPEKSTKDGRWVFDADSARIEKIDQPLLQTQIPNYDFFKVTLKNFLGYHVNQCTCVVLFDSSASKIVLVKPIWFGGVSNDLIKLFINAKFESREELLMCVRGIHEIMEIGSGYRFVQKASTDSLITYDLVYAKGDSYTTGGSGASSTVNYGQDGVWRHIEVEIKNLKIKKYITINPALKDTPKFEKLYRQEIK